MNNTNQTDNLDLSNILGKELNGDLLNLLVTEGRIKFPNQKVGKPSAISTGSTGSCDNPDGTNDKKSDMDQRILDLVANVKENEKFVKLLEDMRDDLIQNMKIKGVTTDITDAAKVLGSVTGDITKEIFNRAETILDPDLIAISSWGYVPKLAALLGDGRVYGPYKNCNEVTKAVFDGFNLATGADTVIEPITNPTIDKTIADTKQSFEDKMKKMFMHILNTLFWDFIWTRMWVAIFDAIEKLLAKPIDTPIIILGSLFKFPKLNTETYYRRGPVHKLLNKLKIAMLCRIPRKAFPDYKPEVTVKVYFKASPKTTGIMMSIADLCTTEFANADRKCVERFNNEYETLDDDGNFPGQERSTVPDETSSKPTHADSSDGKEQLQNIQEVFSAAAEADEDYANSINNCYASNAGDALNVDSGQNTSGVSPDCIAAAKTVLEAVYNDAKFNTGDYAKEKSNVINTLNTI